MNNKLVNSDNKLNRFINYETNVSYNGYIDEICENPDFLCKHKELCGNNTTIYTNVKNIEEICTDIQKAQICDYDIQECIVSAKNNLLEDSRAYISTSFENIIIPIINAKDIDGNQKFIRLPKLMGTKKKNSNEICKVCGCMNRFARSPGSGINDYTSPGQNECVYPDKFEYYYYPVNIQQFRTNITDTPNIVLNKYIILNKNIITITTEDDLSPINLYNILIKNGISQYVIQNFITNILYKNEDQSIKELTNYLKQPNSNSNSKSKFGNNLNFNYKIFFLIILILFLFFKFKNKIV